MNYDNLYNFILVASHGGISQASRITGRPKSSLSRKIIELEEELGVRLFERNSKTIRLTEHGALLFEQGVNPLQEMDKLLTRIRENKSHPCGTLRISSPRLVGELIMGKICAQFKSTYPEVEVLISLEDRYVDPIAESFDIVIRVNPKPTTELVGKCFARDDVLVVSTPKFQQSYNQQAANQTQPLPIISRDNTPDLSSDIWNLYGISTKRLFVKPILQLPYLTMIKDAVLTDLGAAKLPERVVKNELESGELVSWGKANKEPVEIWILHLSRRLVSPKVTAFMQFFENEIKRIW